jgi:hypothetical protein
MRREITENEIVSIASKIRPVKIEKDGSISFSNHFSEIKRLSLMLAAERITTQEERENVVREKLNIKNLETIVSNQRSLLKLTSPYLKRHIEDVISGASPSVALSRDDWNSYFKAVEISVLENANNLDKRQSSIEAYYQFGEFLFTTLRELGVSFIVQPSATRMDRAATKGLRYRGCGGGWLSRVRETTKRYSKYSDRTEDTKGDRR